MRLRDVQYLTVQDVLEVHQAVLLEGERKEVLKPAELDAAVMAVQATYIGAPLLASLAEVAAAYLFYLNQSHVFVDGNKRTSLVAALVFLEANGFRLDLDKRDWVEVVLGIVRREMSRGELVAIFAEEMGTAEELEW